MKLTATPLAGVEPHPPVEWPSPSCTAVTPRHPAGTFSTRLAVVVATLSQLSPNTALTVDEPSWNCASKFHLA